MEDNLLSSETPYSLDELPGILQSVNLQFKAISTGMPTSLEAADYQSSADNMEYSSFEPEMQGLPSKIYASRPVIVAEIPVTFSAIVGGQECNNCTATLSVQQENGQWKVVYWGVIATSTSNYDGATKNWSGSLAGLVLWSDRTWVNLVPTGDEWPITDVTVTDDRGVKLQARIGDSYFLQMAPLTPQAFSVTVDIDFFVFFGEDQIMSFAGIPLWNILNSPQNGL